MDTTSSPSARARCPKAEGRESPPLLPLPSTALHPPARHRPSALGILRGCRGSLPTLTSSLRQEALAGHSHEPGPGANPPHPQRQPGAPPTAGPGGKLYLGRRQLPRAGPSTPILLVRLLKPPSFSSLPGPRCLQNDPRRGDSNPASPTSESIGSQSLGLILPLPLLGPAMRV